MPGNGRTRQDGSVLPTTLVNLQNDFDEGQFGLKADLAWQVY
jgi:hypothetical protein